MWNMAIRRCHNPNEYTNINLYDGIRHVHGYQWDFWCFKVICLVSAIDWDGRSNDQPNNVDTRIIGENPDIIPLCSFFNPNSSLAAKGHELNSHCVQLFRIVWLTHLTREWLLLLITSRLYGSRILGTQVRELKTMGNRTLLWLDPMQSNHIPNVNDIVRAVWRLMNHFEFERK